jgi:ABC-2 type transport system permease protein
MEEQMLPEDVSVEEIDNSNSSHGMPSATQHNIPSWTLFAMFFSVISLGGNIVKEKLSGSFTRLKVLPTSYAVALISKQVVYLMVAVVQVAVIFSIGIWLFPLFGLPALDIPHDVLGLLVISLICGWCAISYALCIGVFAQTQEQANGFGSASVVILAAIGGIFVPSFAMPESFKTLLSLSPFHWGLQSYYGLFLENLPLVQIILNILPLLVSILVLQTISFIGLKRKNLI